MKYLHFLRDHGYPDTPLKEALVSLRKAIRPSTPFGTLQTELLWLQKRQQTPWLSRCLDPPKTLTQKTDKLELAIDKSK